MREKSHVDNVLQETEPYCQKPGPVSLYEDRKRDQNRTCNHSSIVAFQRNIMSLL